MWNILFPGCILRMEGHSYGKEFYKWKNIPGKKVRDQAKTFNLNLSMNVSNCLYNLLTNEPFYQPHRAKSYDIVVILLQI